MKLLPVVLLALLPLPAAAQFISVHGGLAAPVGDFATPPSDGVTELGAKIGYTGGAAYIYQMGPVFLRGSLCFVSCAEKLRSFTVAGNVAKFRHQFFAFSGGLEKQFLRRNAVRPVANLSVGLYIYKTNYFEETITGEPSEYEIAEYNFQMSLIPALRVGTGVIFQVVEELVHLRIEANYHMLFSGTKEGLLGLEGGGLKQDYPYAYDGSKINFWTVTLAFVFQPE
jgi:hypothetical protein